jgi:hypothetical protein
MASNGAPPIFQGLRDSTFIVRLGRADSAQKYSVTRCLEVVELISVPQFHRESPY